MRYMIAKFTQYIRAHKLAVGVAVILLAGGGYYTYGKVFPTVVAPQYVTAAVSKGTLTVSVSGSGQVSASNQVDIKPKASGDITRLNVKSGQEVKTGTVLAQLNAKDALKTVRDAETNLQSARLSLEKLVQSADNLSLLQAENSLTSAHDTLEKLKLTQQTDLTEANDTKQKSADNITKAYEDAFNAISNAFLDFPAIVTSLDDTLHSNAIAEADPAVSASTNVAALYNTLAGNEPDRLRPLVDQAESNYKSTRSAYDQNLVSYKATSRFNDHTAIETLLNETLETAKLLAESAKSELTVLDAWVDIRAQRNATDSNQVASVVSNYRTTLTTSNGKVNNHISALLGVQRTLKDNQESLASAERTLVKLKQNQPLDIAAAEQTVKEREASLVKLKAGADKLDVASQQLTIRQRESALSDAQQKLADYTVRAPLDGIVAELNSKLGDSVSSSTVLATLVTKQKIAEVSLNEVDVAKMQVGQKATLTFDAVEGLTITGEVVEIGALGVVNQGVVSYNIKISFDTQDERIKSGMTVAAAIITNIKSDVLLVPGSAIQQQGDSSFVEVLVNGQPEVRQVTVGLSNDITTEVSGDIKEGEEVVTQTITAQTTAASSTQSGTSLFGGGLGGSGRAR